MTFADAQLPFDYPAAAFLMMGLNGMFAVLAALGGIMFIVVVVGSVFFGTQARRRRSAQLPRSAAGRALRSAAWQCRKRSRFRAPAVLVGVFFAAFVLYYFVNWKYLSEIWPLS